jgi:hypothetical protein
MHFIPVLWIAWGVFAAMLLSLLLYRGTITRYEDDQLFDRGDHWDLRLGRY